jgi:hypothetical protein
VQRDSMSRYLARKTWSVLGSAGATLTHGLHPRLRVADVLPDAARRADWSRVNALHKQCMRIRAAGVELPKELLDGLANAIHGLSSAYNTYEDEMCLHALAVFANASGQETLTPEVCLSHYDDESLTRFDGTGPTARRLPPPYEALVETCRRRRDACAVRRALKDAGTSGLLCGSANYGAFYNVRGCRGDEPGSDLDCIIVLGDPRSLDRILDELTALPGINRVDLGRLAERARLFTQRFDDQQTVLSHKLRLWSGSARDVIMAPIGGRHDYLLSLHFVTAAVLSYLLVDSVPRIDRDAAGGCRTIRVYRETAPLRHDHQRSFGGASHVLDLETTQTVSGYLRKTRVYHIDQLDAYFPGFFQSMLVPRPTLLWDDLEIRPRLDQFQQKIGERIRYENSRDGYTMRRPSFAHPRRAVFAPGVIQQLDGPYSGS